MNYDCDMTCHNVFASLVDVISKSARLPISEISPQKERDREMRLLGLSCLVEMMKGQVDWYLMSENERTDSSTKEGEKKGKGKKEEDLNHLEHQKQMKDKMEQGIEMFGRKAKDGLAFLQVLYTIICLLPIRKKDPFHSEKKKEIFTTFCR